MTYISLSTRQSHFRSILEAWTNIAVGLGLQTGVLALIGLPPTTIGSLAFIMTILSVARSYVIRRIFNSLQ